VAQVRLFVKSSPASDFIEASGSYISGNYGSITPGSFLSFIWDPIKDAPGLDADDVQLRLRVEY